MAAAAKLRHAKHRRDSGLLLIEGPHAIAAAIAAEIRLREIFCLPDYAESDAALLAGARDAGGKVRLVTPNVLGRIAETTTPQGVVATAEAPVGDLDTALGRGSSLLAVLAGVSDPGNAGTIIRTADALGASAVVLTADSVDPWSGKCIRASAGSVFHLPIVTAVAPAHVVPRLSQAGITTLAATTSGDAVVDEPEIRRVLAGNVAWLFGNESRGLDPGLERSADHRVRIPIAGKAESLNLAVAAAICLFVTVRAKHPQPS